MGSCKRYVLVHEGYQKRVPHPLNCYNFEFASSHCHHPLMMMIGPKSARGLVVIPLPHPSTAPRSSDIQSPWNGPRTTAGRYISTVSVRRHHHHHRRLYRVAWGWTRQRSTSRSKGGNDRIARAEWWYPPPRRHPAPGEWPRPPYLRATRDVTLGPSALPW